MIYFLEAEAGCTSLESSVDNLMALSEQASSVWFLSSTHGRDLLKAAAERGAVKVGYTSGGYEGAEKRRLYWEKKTGVELRFARASIGDEGRSIRLVRPLWFYHHPLDVVEGSFQHEQGLHAIFSRAHVCGEWFLPTVLGFLGGPPTINRARLNESRRCGLCYAAPLGAGKCCGASACGVLCSRCRINQHRSKGAPGMSRDVEGRLSAFVGKGRA